MVRWRLYLQSFVFEIKHISGKANVCVDMLALGCTCSGRTTVEMEKLRESDNR